jgi:tetraacyldisaccharide 4'-kinase
VKRPALGPLLLRAWYGSASWLALLRPLSWFYTFVVRRRRARALANSCLHRPPAPLIVVGNITLGGTGKTPMVLWLIDHLREKGLRVGVVSRGYGARPPSFPWLIDPRRDLPSDVGDEPWLIASRTGVPVMVDPDRARAVAQLLETGSADLLISDDGLQHYRMPRSLELVMIDYQRGLGNRRCLPEGPLREPVERLESVDLVVYNGAPSDTGQGFAMQLQPVAFIALRSGQRILPRDWDGPLRVNAVAGIGNPQRFFATLRQLGLDPVEYSFPDHARYDAQSFAGMDRTLPLIMTEKDAVKCAAFALENWWYLAVEASLSEGFVHRLDSLLKDHNNLD